MSAYADQQHPVPHHHSTRDHPRHPVMQLQYGYGPISHPPPQLNEQRLDQHVSSFAPNPAAQRHKRFRRRYAMIERMYKCGWNDCEKVYGTLSHLNTHVTRRSHGQKRTPEEFKTIRNEWKSRKWEEQNAYKQEEKRQFVARQQNHANGQPGGEGRQEHSQSYQAIWCRPAPSSLVHPEGTRIEKDDGAQRAVSNNIFTNTYNIPFGTSSHESTRTRTLTARARAVIEAQSDTITIQNGVQSTAHSGGENTDQESESMASEPKIYLPIVSVVLGPVVRKLEALDGHMEKWNNSVNQKETEMGDLQTSILEIGAQNTALHEVIRQYETRIANLETKIAKLETQTVHDPKS